MASASLAAYDDSNIFAKILRGEIPSYKIFETEHALAILDAFPCCAGHSLLIPKACSRRSCQPPCHSSAAATPLAAPTPPPLPFSEPSPN